MEVTVNLKFKRHLLTTTTAALTRILCICLCVQIDNREFRVTGAIDSLTARRIDAAEARERGILVDGGGTGPTSPTRPRSPTRSVHSPSGSSSAGHPEHDEDYEYYLVEATGERIPLHQAIDVGWVLVEYDDNDNQLEQQVCTCTRVGQKVLSLTYVQKR